MNQESARSEYTYTIKRVHVQPEGHSEYVKRYEAWYKDEVLLRTSITLRGAKRAVRAHAAGVKARNEVPADEIVWHS